MLFRSDREMGNMRTLLVSPLPRGYLLFCKLLAGTAVSLLQVYAFLLIAWFWDITPPTIGYLTVLPALVLSGLMLGAMTAGCPRHDLITLTGGAIGQGLPMAVGAAIACPDRPVLALVGDGSAMYTLQALWTMAREGLNVVTVVFNNRAYAILNMELQRVGAAGKGEKAKSQLDLDRPGLDFVELARGMGVQAVRATTGLEFIVALEHALATPGPHLIDAIVPSAYTGLKLKVLPTVLGALEHLPGPVARAIKNKVAP